jgi:anti-sigma regulatory factor (Ser/Thr protein kinase)
VDDELLRIEVADKGAWRDPVPNDERGRGILLMENLMHEVEIDRTEQGTKVTLKRRRGVPVSVEPATLRRS